MAPLSKKAKLAAQPAPGGGLGKFFGNKNAGVPAVAAPTPVVATQAPAAGGLTEDQKKLIEENRRRALLRKQAKANGEPPPVFEDLPKPVVPAPTVPVAPTPARKVVNAFDDEDFGAGFDEADMDDDRDADRDAGQEMAPSPVKSAEQRQSLKRNGSDITPEKTSMPPKEQRRVLVPDPPATPVVQQRTGGSGPLVRVSTAAVATAENEVDVGSGEDRFKTFGKVLWRQYDSAYKVRLAGLRATVLAQAKSLWSSEIPADNFLSHIGANSAGFSEDVVLVGVTFKSMPSRDNVIVQYRDCYVATSTLPEDDVDKQANLCSDKDVLWLEDAMFRIELALPAEKVAKMATGFVAAVRGSVTADGKFETKDICMAQVNTSTPLPKSLPVKGPYVALLSGMFVGAPDEDIPARNRAVDFLLGKGQKGNALKLSKAVQHVIFCGGVYHVDKLGDVPAGLQDADSMFAQLAEKLPVEVLPGHKDPSNLSLPQMPLHPFFFKTAAKCEKFKAVSNPHRCTLGDLEMQGHSGQPIRDLMRCTSISSPMEALKTCLDASLIAPTAPDTLATQSFKEADPFIMEKNPKVFFSGGHSKAEYEWRAPASGDTGTLCVCVPAFHQQPAVVLVNLSDPRDIIVQDFGK